MKTKKIFLLVLFVSCLLSTIAQNKIGNNPTIISQGSLLELESLTKGLRLTRIPLNDVKTWSLDGSAMSGMLIFNETGAAPKGMYYWNMELAQWVRIVAANELAALITEGTTVSNNINENKLTTIVNGVSALGIDIIKNNSLAIVNGVLTSTVNGIASNPGVKILSSAENGLTESNGNVQLGGVLTKPTNLTTSATNTLSLSGLSDADVNVDEVLMITPGKGVVRKLSLDELTTSVYKSITYAHVDGQRCFTTPLVITDLKKIQVYRNGISVEFRRFDEKIIELEDLASCFVDDEIKITQIK